MSTSPDRLVWIDCEMTGLDPEKDELVEVAVIVTDFALTVLDAGLDLIIKPGDAALAHMDDFVRAMHTTSGLLDEIPTGLALADAETQVIDYIDRFVPHDKQAPLAGNTIGTDRMFLVRYMPHLDARLHYRNVDVSSIKELARRWYPRVYFNAPEKHGGHRALADIRESIRELDYYRRVVFVADPGPDTDTVKSVAATVTDEWASRM
ncbi:MAG TPA: oligoribonuclease [Microbacteriaceae bacterium]|nr:oligoribonuclease [Microbacteriaceae bacterium]